MAPAEPELYENHMIARALERGDIAAAGFWQRVKDDVDKAPPLTPEQISTIRVLLAPELRAARAA